MKKLTQGMAEHNKAMAAAKSDEAKDSIVSLFLKGPLILVCFLFYFYFIFHFLLAENSKAEYYNWIAHLQ